MTAEQIRIYPNMNQPTVNLIGKDMDFVFRLGHSDCECFLGLELGLTHPAAVNPFSSGYTFSVRYSAVQ